MARLGDRFCGCALPCCWWAADGCCGWGARRRPLSRPPTRPPPWQPDRYHRGHGDAGHPTTAYLSRETPPATCWCRCPVPCRLAIRCQGALDALAGRCGAADGPTRRGGQGLTTAISDGIDGRRWSVDQVVTTIDGTIAIVRSPSPGCRLRYDPDRPRHLPRSSSPSPGSMASTGSSSLLGDGDGCPVESSPERCSWYPRTSSLTTRSLISRPPASPSRVSCRWRSSRHLHSDAQSTSRSPPRGRQLDRQPGAADPGGRRADRSGRRR